jgi:hypothetical protein
MKTLDDALDDGKVTIYRVNYENGQILDPIGDYNVDQLTLQALREYKAQFLAGVLGPDVYPDIITGQSAIHPHNDRANYVNSAGSSDAWLRYIWDKAEADNTLPVRAFAIGYLTHGAGDSYAHTFVNYFAGGPFEPGRNAIKHIILESYIGDRAPTLDPYVVSIEGVEDFIAKTLVIAEPESDLMRLLESTNKPATKGTPVRLALIPLTFSKLRNALKRSLQQGRVDSRRADHTRKWISYIDDGLKDWVRLSDDIGQALFHNDKGEADFERARKLVEEYNNEHLVRMMYGPVGELKVRLEKPIRDMLDPLREKVRKERNRILKALFKKILKQDWDEFKEYYTNPAKYLESKLNDPDWCGPHSKKPRGQCISHSNLDRLLGVTHNGSDKFNHLDFAPAYNTILMTKLLLLGEAEMNRLLQDLGATAGYGEGAVRMRPPNAMLGFNQSLDGSNQWVANEAHNRMALVRGVVYDQIFKKQIGEASGIELYLKEKAKIYKLVGARSAVRTYNREGWLQAYENGRVYWSPGNGVRVLLGPIMAKWDTLGGEGGLLGFPVSDPLRLSDAQGGDWYQFFERGAIYLRGSDNAALTFMKRLERDVEQANPAVSIQHKAEFMGLGRTHALTPTPMASTDNTAWWQRFERGYVYWTKKGGAKWLSKPIWDVWAEILASLGPPVTDELEAQGGDEHDRYQLFERGMIYRRINSNLIRVAYIRP